MIRLEDLVFYSAGNRFDYSDFKPVCNGRAWDNKPTGGYWASPVFHPIDWLSWIDQQKRSSAWSMPPLKGGTFFRLRDRTRIAYIVTPDSYDYIARGFALKDEPRMPFDATLLDYVLLNEEGEDPLAFKPLNYEALAASGYDAIYCEPAAFKVFGPRAAVHAWDCATLLVLNPSVMQDIHYSSALCSRREDTAFALYPMCRPAFVELRFTFDRRDWLRAWLYLLSALQDRGATEFRSPKLPIGDWLRKPKSELHAEESDVSRC